MRLLATLVTTALLIAGCASTPDTPQQEAQELATDRFEKCMEDTVPKFFIFKIATADQRLKAAEVCKGVMSQGPAEPSGNR